MIKIGFFAGFCSGDSGGVLMEKDSEVAVGLVSHHFGKCSASNPKVITKVSFFTNWIKKTIGN